MIVAAFVGAVLSLSLQAVEPEARAGASDPCSVPAKLREALHARYGTARVLKSADLYEDERRLFKAAHPRACPGVATGKFFGSRERPAVALVILDVEPKKNIRLVVARPALSNWTLVELDELDAGATAVVSRGAPGPYTDSATAMTRASANDVVSLTSFETWRRAYIWNGRTFERLQASE